MTSYCEECNHEMITINVNYFEPIDINHKQAIRLPADVCEYCGYVQLPEPVIDTIEQLRTKTNRLATYWFNGTDEFIDSSDSGRPVPNKVSDDEITVHCKKSP